MDISKMTKKQLGAVIDSLSTELRMRQQAAESEKSEKLHNYHNFESVKYALRVQRTHASTTNDLATSLLALLNTARKENEIFLRIQQQLIAMLGNKVWICPSCGRVADGKEGPHFTLCADCINAFDK
jgi:rubrerythrin